MNTNGKQSPFSQLPPQLQKILKDMGADESKTTVYEFGGKPAPAEKPEPTTPPVAKTAPEQSSVDPIVTDILAILGYGAQQVSARAKELVGGLCQAFKDIKEELSKELPPEPLEDWEKGVIIGKNISVVNAAEQRCGRKAICQSEEDYLTLAAFVLCEAERFHIQDGNFSSFTLQTIVNQRPVA